MVSLQKTIIAHSGGIDSTTLIAYLLNEEHKIQLVNFIYGSKHNFYEIEAAAKIAKHYKLNDPIQINCAPIFKHMKSNLLLQGGEIPEGHYDDESMSKTVVPGRNGIFLITMAAIAESKGYNNIAIGVHQGDHHIYPDCRPEFISNMKMAIFQQSEFRIELMAPFLNFDKREIVKIGNSLNVPFELTRTCYKAQEKACGRCGSCTERLEAFNLNNNMDPIEYENK